VGLTLFRRDVRRVGPRAVNLVKGIIGSTLFLLVLLFHGARPISLEAQGYLALSGVIGLALGDSFLFAALGTLGAHRTALLSILGPVFTAWGGWIFLGETLRWPQVLGVALVLSGLVLVVGRRGGDPARGRATLRGAAFGLLFAICQATGVLLAKRGLAGAEVLPSTAIRLLSATAALALFALFRRDLGTGLVRLLAPRAVARLLPAAFFATFLGLLLMQLGIQRTHSAVANALHSTTPLFTLPITVFFLRVRVPPAAVIGSFLAVGGVALLFAR